MTRGVATFLVAVLLMQGADCLPSQLRPTRALSSSKHLASGSAIRREGTLNNVDGEQGLVEVRNTGPNPNDKPCCYSHPFKPEETHPYPGEHTTDVEPHDPAQHLTPEGNSHYTELYSEREPRENTEPLERDPGEELERTMNGGDVSPSNGPAATATETASASPFPSISPSSSASDTPWPSPDHDSPSPSPDPSVSPSHPPSPSPVAVSHAPLPSPPPQDPSSLPETTASPSPEPSPEPTPNLDPVAVASAPLCPEMVTDYKEFDPVGVLSVCSVSAMTLASPEAVVRCVEGLSLTLRTLAYHSGAVDSCSLPVQGTHWSPESTTDRQLLSLCSALTRPVETLAHTLHATSIAAPPSLLHDVAGVVASVGLRTTTSLPLHRCVAALTEHIVGLPFASVAPGPSSVIDRVSDLTKIHGYGARLLELVVLPALPTSPNATLLADLDSQPEPLVEGLSDIARIAPSVLRLARGGLWSLANNATERLSGLARWETVGWASVDVEGSPVTLLDASSGQLDVSVTFRPLETPSSALLAPVMGGAAAGSNALVIATRYGPPQSQRNCFPLATVAIAPAEQHVGTGIVELKASFSPNPAIANTSDIVCALNSRTSGSFGDWKRQATCAISASSAGVDQVLGVFTSACLFGESPSTIPVALSQHANDGTVKPDESVEARQDNDRRVGVSKESHRTFFGQSELNGGDVDVVDNEGESSDWWPIIASAGVTLMCVAVLVISILIFAAVKKASVETRY